MTKWRSSLSSWWRQVRKLWRRIHPGYLLSGVFLKMESIETAFPSAAKQLVYEGELVQTPELADMNIFIEARHLQNPVYRIRDMYSMKIGRALYYSASPSYAILMKNRRTLIRESSSTMDKVTYFKWYPLVSSPRRKVVGTCTALRYVSNNYYHTLVDNLPRMAALNHECFRKIPEIKVLVPVELTAVEEYFLERLLPANAVIEYTGDKVICDVEDYLFLNFVTERFGGCLPGWYMEYLGKHVMPQREGRRNRCIYISRRRASVRRVLNEDELATRLEGVGFERFVLEELSMADQVELFHDARIVVAPHGAGLTNILFSRNISVVELFPTRLMKPSYYFMSKSLGHDYSVLHSDARNINDDFSVDVDYVLHMVQSRLA